MLEVLMAENKIHFHGIDGKLFYSETRRIMKKKERERKKRLKNTTMQS